MSKMKWLVTLLGMDVSRGFNDDNFWTDCPCHKDENTCLHVYKCVDGRIEMHCHVCGARSKNVCEKVGIPLEELEPEKDLLKAIGRTEHYDNHRWRAVRAAAKRRSTPETWNDALEAASSAVVCVLDAIAGDRQVASDQLIDALVGAFADRLGSMVSIRIMRDLEASTPPMDKTDRPSASHRSASATGSDRFDADGFEGSEENG